MIDALLAFGLLGFVLALPYWLPRVLDLMEFNDYPRYGGKQPQKEYHGYHH